MHVSMSYISGPAIRACWSYKTDRDYLLAVYVLVNQSAKFFKEKSGLILFKEMP